MRVSICCLAMLALLNAALGCSYDLDAFRDKAGRHGADASDERDGGLDAGDSGGGAGDGGATAGMDAGPGGVGGLAGTGAVGGVDGALGGAGGRGGIGGMDGGPGGEGGAGGSAGTDGGPGGDAGTGGTGGTEGGRADAGTDGETGVGCESACTVPCYSCNVPEQLGTCAPVPSGTDPDDDCGSCDVCDGEGSCRPVDANEPDPKGECADELSTDACGENGLCDGAGACAYKRTIDAICNTTCTDDEGSIWACTAEHSCEVSNSAPCPASGGGECNETGDDCIYVCADDSECPSATHFCCRPGDDALCDVSTDVNNCVLKSNQGDDCIDDRQCNTGHCTDNVCCSSADCPGDCHACNIPGPAPGQCAHYDDSDSVESNDAPDGTCTPSLCRGCNGSSDDCVDVEYPEDWHDDCTGQPPSSCGLTGACNGAGACELYDDTTDCNDGEDCTHSDKCNGSGGCQGSPITCDDEPGTCGLKRSCNGTSSCTETYPGPSTSCGDPTDDECTDPDSCNGAGTCDPNHEDTGTSCGDTTDDECTNPDTCDGGGACQSNHASDGIACYGEDQRIYDGLCSIGSCVGTDYCDTYRCWSVPPTGQSDCYDNTSVIPCGDLPFPCDASGGPEFCGQDAQYPDNPRTFTESTVGGDEIVADSLTGLVWEKGYIPSDDGLDWFEADDHCDTLSYADETDWRLPDHIELASLLSHGRYLPASDFPHPDGVSLYSSTRYEDDGGGSTRSWRVELGAGEEVGLFDTTISAVRCVRGEPVAPDSGLRFHIMGTSGSETVRDRATGLLWQGNVPDLYYACTAGDPAGSACHWQQALAYCEGLAYGGHDDWRLPNMHELRSLLTPGAGSIHSNFPGMPGVWFWSSTSYPSFLSAAWAIHFGGPSTNSLGKMQPILEVQVRCVRGGP